MTATYPEMTSHITIDGKGNTFDAGANTNSIHFFQNHIRARNVTLT